MIEIHDAGSLLPPDGEELLRRAASAVFIGEGIAAVELSLAVVDDPEMHRLNREFLQHDYPTDVLTFRLDDAADGAFSPASLRASAANSSPADGSDDAENFDDEDDFEDDENEDAADFDDDDEEEADDDDFDEDDAFGAAPPTGGLEGEVVVSADYAAAEAARRGWSALEELTLYVVHGCLHLAGYDDLTPEAAALMREAERKYIAQLGLPTDKVGAAHDKVGEPGGGGGA